MKDAIVGILTNALAFVVVTAMWGFMAGVVWVLFKWFMWMSLYDSP